MKINAFLLHKKLYMLLCTLYWLYLKESKKNSCYLTIFGVIAVMIEVTAFFILPKGDVVAVVISPANAVKNPLPPGAPSPDTVVT